MHLDHFLASSKILIVAGKGGVGKTTFAATLALAATQRGRTVLLIELAGRFDAVALFNVTPKGYDEQSIYQSPNGNGGMIRYRSLTPDGALVDWLTNHGFSRLVTQITRSHLLELISTATPGIKDLLMLGKIKHLEQTSQADLIVVDAPATGHAMHFLKAPKAVHQTVRTGVLRQQATETLEMLNDERRCRALLVTIAEETPIAELIETAFAVEDEVGLALGPVVVNNLLPHLAGLNNELDLSTLTQTSNLTETQTRDLVNAANFRAQRMALQQKNLNVLSQTLPLKQIHMPALFTSSVGISELETLTEALNQAVNETLEGEFNSFTLTQHNESQTQTAQPNSNDSGS